MISVSAETGAMASRSRRSGSVRPRSPRFRVHLQHQPAARRRGRDPRRRRRWRHPAGRCSWGCRSVPELSRSSPTMVVSSGAENDWPQAREPVALGLLNLKPVWVRGSRRSRREPPIIGRLMGSTSSLNSSISNSKSSALFSCSGAGRIACPNSRRRRRRCAVRRPAFRP